MDQAIQLIADTGVALRREMIRFGVTDREIAASLRHGVLRRVDRAPHTTPDQWDGRHRGRPAQAEVHVGDAVAGRPGGPVPSSSLVMQDVPVWAANLDVVHVTRLDGGVGGPTPACTTTRVSLSCPCSCRRQPGLATPAARAVIEHGTVHTVESTLVSADGALNLGLCTDTDLAAEQHLLMERWPGTQHLQVVVRLADGDAQSPGETRSRYLCWRHGLPAPVLQFEVYDETGQLSVAATSRGRSTGCSASSTAG